MMELASLDSALANAAALPPADNAPPPPGLLERGFDDVTSQDFAGRAARTFRAGVSKVVENDLGFGVSDDVVMARQYAPILEAINQQQQRGFADFVDNPFLSSSLNPLNAAKRLATGQPLTRDGLIDYVWQQVDQGRKDNPGLFGQLPKNHDEVIADAQAEQRSAIGYSNELAESGGPLSGTGASFAGQVVGGMADPVNIAATALGFPASESLLKTALIEGGANLAVDAAGLPGRYKHYEAIGEPMSAGDVAGELAGSTLLGAGLGTAGKLIARVAGLKGHALADEFAAQNPDAPPMQRTAMAMVQAEADLAHSNPFSADAAGEDLHRQAVVAAMGALDDRRPDQMPDFNIGTVRDVTPGEIAMALEDVKARASAAPSEASLFQEIRKLGGLKLTDAAGKPTMGAAEIRQIMDTNRSLVNNKSGFPPDRMREALAERGWFDGTRDTSQSDLNDFHALIDQEARGNKVYHPESGIHADLAYRELLDREQTEAGIKASDSQGIAAKKLAEFRAEQAHFLADRQQAEIDRQMGLSQQAQEALSSHGYEPGSDPGAEFETDASPEQSGGAGQTAGGQAFGGGSQGGAGIARQAGGRAEVPQEARGELAAAAIKASAFTHTRGHDPEALTRFSDPIKKPDAFVQQADDLARELAPPPEKPAVANTGEAKPENPFGEAQGQIEALRRMDQASKFPDPATGAEISIQSERRAIELQARAVERLRACVEGPE